MVVGHDLLMVWICWEALHRLRYAMLPEPPTYPLWSPEIAIVVISQGLVFWWVGLYRGLWRFASVPDLGNILKASLIGLLALALGLALYNRLGSVPRAVLVMYPFLLVGLLGMPRLMFRAWKDNQNTDSKNGIALRVLILGAGRSSEAMK
jgi:FlaA1/EpsC-like NDP-sugar epimerase